MIYEFEAFLAGVITGLILALTWYCWRKFFYELFGE